MATRAVFALFAQVLVQVWKKTCVSSGLYESNKQHEIEQMITFTTITLSSIHGGLQRVTKFYLPHGATETNFI